MNPFRFIRHILFLLAYHLYAKRKILNDDTTSLLGFTLHVPYSVFHPRLYFTSEFLCEYVKTLDLRAKTVLDVGCGSGIISLVCAAHGASVTAIDLNPIAIEATKENSIANRCESNIEVIQSDLFSNIPHDSRFDLIIFNPPYYQKEATDDFERAFCAGKNFDVIKRFAQQASSYLHDGGSILIILTSDVDEREILSSSDEHDWKIARAKSRHVFFERLTIYSLRKL